MGYDKWAGIFSHQWMKSLTFVVIVALLVHVWVGMRDILMDYLHATGVRLTMQATVGLALLFYLAWAASILWGR